MWQKQRQRAPGAHRLWNDKLCKKRRISLGSGLVSSHSVGRTRGLFDRASDFCLWLSNNGPGEIIRERHSLKVICKEVAANRDTTLNYLLIKFCFSMFCIERVMEKVVWISPTFMSNTKNKIRYNVQWIYDQQINKKKTNAVTLILENA